VIDASIAITGFGGFIDYFRLMNILARHPEVGYIAPAQMPDARGFLFALFPRAPQVQIFLAALIGIALLAISTAQFSQHRETPFDVWFALNLFVTAIASPHLYRHDLTPLILAILLCWNAALSSRVERRFFLLFGVVTLLLFATPVYELLNDRGATNSFFLVLLLGVIKVTLLQHGQKEISAKT
jgi:hypothetical protein